MTQTKPVWKRDPRGVDYVTFTVPSEAQETDHVFQFETPRLKEMCTVEVTNAEEVLGVIILMKPHKDEN